MSLDLEVGLKGRPVNLTTHSEAAQRRGRPVLHHVVLPSAGAGGPAERRPLFPRHQGGWLTMFTKALSRAIKLCGFVRHVLIALVFIFQFHAPVLLFWAFVVIYCFNLFDSIPVHVIFQFVTVFPFL